MVKSTILSEVLNELKRAKKLHPNWPEHIVAKAAIVCEEAGELVRACLIWKYERAAEGTPEYYEQLNDMRKEAIHTAATALRFLENIDSYEPISKRNNDTETPDIGLQDAGNSIAGEDEQADDIANAV